MKICTYFSMLASLLFLGSCNNYKKVIYFQDLDRTTVRTEDIANYSPLLIQTEDILSISVSSMNPEASAVFSFSSSGSSASGSGGSEYLVDHRGMIHFPLLGSIKVTGYTTAALRDEIQKKLLFYLKEPIVNIRVVNFKVSVIGDVSSPGVYQITNEKITIPEILAMAGDLNVTARRNNIILIREQNGTRKYVPVDLTKNLFKSQYYYLKNNDLIYVQPDRSKVSSGASKSVSILMTAISIATLVLQITR